jgi:hypothetical protein
MHGVYLKITEQTVTAFCKIIYCEIQKQKLIRLYEKMQSFHVLLQVAYIITIGR